MEFQTILEEIKDEIFKDLEQGLIERGKVADYIPALAEIKPDKFAIAIETIDGQYFQTGDASERFSIQSISKVFNLALAHKLVGDELWHRVGMEPSGNPFNSLIQLEYEKGIPRNPFINAGALVVIDVLLNHLTNPDQDMVDFVGRLRCSEIRCNPEVFNSERKHGFNNIALVNFMKGHGNIHNDVDKVLDLYYHQCAIEMNCAGLARTFLFLANGGLVPVSNDRILTERQTKRVNAILLTCGSYDEAGQFAYRIGLPAKSGVGGGIVAVIPGKLSIAVWSPGLNQRGNSIIGTKALELFTTKTQYSIF